jgi:hypothetical protein
VSGTAASSPSWSCSNGGIDWLHAVISLQIHPSVQAFLARLRPRFAVQLLAVLDAVQSSLLLLLLLLLLLAASLMTLHT